MEAAAAAANLGLSVMQANSQYAEAKQAAKVQRVQDEVKLTQMREKTQSDLQKSLAARQVAYAARGISATSGSPLLGQIGDASEAATQMRTINLQDEQSQENKKYAVGVARSARRGAIVGSLFKTATSVV